MFCPKCGKQITGNEKFCAACGAPIGGAAPVGAAPAAPAAPTAPMGSLQVHNLQNNSNIVLLNEKGCFKVYEHQKDISIGSPSSAVLQYYMHQMNMRKRQVLCTLGGNAVKVQAGAMQWTGGQVTMNSGVKGVGNFLGKAIKGAVTGESAAKPIYSGSGLVMLEPTYKYIFLEDLSNWGSGIMLDDGLFLACDATVQEEVISRKNFSSAMLGGEGLFNLCLSGQGVAVLESPVPREELIEFELNNSEVRIDGNMAIAWSKSLQFTVEKSTKSLLGSWASGEGFVNVYRGTGKILMTPTANGTLMSQSNSPKEAEKSSSAGILGSVLSSALDL
ncbi:MAG: AIM24 family protein [Clostridia bacterium]|nr:AIM24 family protein [Clostridia bacterium]